MRKRFCSVTQSFFRHARPRVSGLTLTQGNTNSVSQSNEHKPATVHRLPCTSRLQRAGWLTVLVPVDLRKPLTREAITQQVYRLSKTWGYVIVFDGDKALVQSIQDPVYAASAKCFLARNLPAVVEYLMTAQH